jgi:hypothetical protein
MLIEFSLENYRSIRAPVTLSMVASNGRQLPGNCAPCPGVKRLRLLKCVVLYGANASGKSNVAMGLRCLSDLVRRGPRAVSSPYIPRLSPFRLDPASAARPSRFEIIFTVNETRFIYGLSISESRIHQEWLHAYPRGRRRVIFERGTDVAEGGARLKTGPDWAAQARTEAASVSNEALLLTHTSADGLSLVREARDWFQHDIRCVGATPDLTGELDATREMAAIDPEARQRLVEFLRLADLGISDFRIEPEMTDASPRAGGSPEKKAKITLIHEAMTEGGEALEIPLDSFEEESSGTQKFFALAGAWFRALHQGSLLVIDELDLRLHPLLTRRLVELFCSEASNPKGAQLIFTTHDSSLLNAELFRRDQIWFAEKTPDGTTSLYSLSDFRPHRGESFRMGYLEGRYGAIPFVGDLP